MLPSKKFFKSILQVNKCEPHRIFFGLCKFRSFKACRFLFHYYNQVRFSVVQFIFLNQIHVVLCSLQILDVFHQITAITRFRESSLSPMSTFTTICSCHHVAFTSSLVALSSHRNFILSLTLVPATRAIFFSFWFSSSL